MHCGLEVAEVSLRTGLAMMRLVLVLRPRRMPDRSRRSSTSPSRGLEEPRATQNRNTKISKKSHVTFWSFWSHELPRYISPSQRFPSLFRQTTTWASTGASSPTSSPPCWPRRGWGRAVSSEPRGTTHESLLRVEVRYPPSSLSFTWKARPMEAQDLKSGTSV